MPMHKLAAAGGEHGIDRADERPASAEEAIGVAVIGADDRIEYCNAQYPRLWGIPALRLIGGLGGLDPEDARSLMNGILFRQDAIRTRNIVHLGDGRSLELVTVSARDFAGPGMRRVTFVRDVTAAHEPKVRRLERVLAGLVVALILVVAGVAWSQPSRTSGGAGRNAFAVASIDPGQVGAAG
ncbi:MAG TPA: hypothetical protein VGM25_03400 [Caulobacteraceae bacterium]|jgi:PAS domain-containing protein